jgi:hypothetical protein
MDIGVPEELPVLKEDQAPPQIAAGMSAIRTPPLSRKRMREEPVEYHELTGRLARMIER